VPEKITKSNKTACDPVIVHIQVTRKPTDGCFFCNTTALSNWSNAASKDAAGRVGICTSPVEKCIRAMQGIFFVKQQGLMPEKSPAVQGSIDLRWPI
jgi:hypothetical protein